MLATLDVGNMFFIMKDGGMPFATIVGYLEDVTALDSFVQVKRDGGGSQK